MSETPREKTLEDIRLKAVEGIDPDKALSVWNKIAGNKKADGKPVTITSEKNYSCQENHFFGLKEPHWVITRNDGDETTQFVLISEGKTFAVAQEDIWRKEPNLRLSTESANSILDDIIGNSDEVVKGAIEETRGKLS
jgi:hypothetical protein